MEIVMTEIERVHSWDVHFNGKRTQLVVGQIQHTQAGRPFWSGRDLHEPVVGEIQVFEVGQFQ